MLSGAPGVRWPHSSPTASVFTLLAGLLLIPLIKGATQLVSSRGQSIQAAVFRILAYVNALSPTNKELACLGLTWIY
jgi:hypothetical protein